MDDKILDALEIGLDAQIEYHNYLRCEAPSGNKERRVATSEENIRKITEAIELYKALIA